MKKTTQIRISRELGEFLREFRDNFGLKSLDATISLVFFNSINQMDLARYIPKSIEKYRLPPFGDNAQNNNNTGEK